MDALNLRIGNYTADEDLIAAALADRQAHARVARVRDSAVVLGRGSRPEIELVLDACLADGVAIQRRRGGGCAVFLDPGNLVVSVALPVSGIGGNHEYFTRISAWLVRALNRLGVEDVFVENLSDLTVGNRKVGGAAIHRTKDLLYYTATLLAKPDVSLMERYLAHPPKEPAYRRGRRHRDFVGALRLPPTAGEIELFAQHLQDALLTTMPRLTGQDSENTGR